MLTDTLDVNQISTDINTIKNVYKHDPEIDTDLFSSLVLLCLYHIETLNPEYPLDLRRGAVFNHLSQLQLTGAFQMAHVQQAVRFILARDGLNQNHIESQQDLHLARIIAKPDEITLVFKLLCHQAQSLKENYPNTNLGLSSFFKLYKKHDVPKLQNMNSFYSSDHDTLSGIDQAVRSWEGLLLNPFNAQLDIPFNTQSPLPVLNASIQRQNKTPNPLSFSLHSSAEDFPLSPMSEQDEHTEHFPSQYNQF